MNLSKLTEKEKYTLRLINKDRVENKKKPIKWESMPEQEVLTHLYGWDNKHVHIRKLLTPQEKYLLINKGYKIGNKLKKNVPLLESIRRLRKNPNK